MLVFARIAGTVLGLFLGGLIGIGLAALVAALVMVIAEAAG
jgi:hypothetical protein